MCFVLYLASAKHRPVIAWDDNSPSFHVPLDDDDAAKTAPHFTKPIVHYVGSDNRCGCGFRQEYDHMSDDPEQIASKNENQRRLHDYAAACLTDEDWIELYSCWSGDESLPYEHSRKISLDELLADEFAFLERQLTVVKLSGTS